MHGGRTMAEISACQKFRLHPLLPRTATRPGRPANGLRLFSRRLLDRVRIESSVGFAYGIELLVKCHRLGWNIAEVPAVWYERTTGPEPLQGHPLASGIPAMVFLRFRDHVPAQRPRNRTR